MRFSFVRSFARWLSLVFVALLPQTCLVAPAIAQPAPCAWRCVCVAGAPLTPAARITGQPAGVVVYVPGKGHPLYRAVRAWAWVERDSVCIGRVTRWRAGAAYRAERLLPDTPAADSTQRTYYDVPPYTATYSARATAVRWLWHTTPAPAED